LVVLPSTQKEKVFDVSAEIALDVWEEVHSG
jgi:hypothetical protein